MKKKKMIKSIPCEWDKNPKKHTLARRTSPLSPYKRKPKNRYLQSEDWNLPIAAVETIQSNGWSIVLCRWGVTSRPLRLICPMETSSGQSKCCDLYQSDHMVRKLTTLLLIIIHHDEEQQPLLKHKYMYLTLKTLSNSPIGVLWSSSGRFSMSL